VLFPALIALVLVLPSPSESQRPAWIESLPSEPGRLYALGTADFGPATSEGRALAQASDRARLEVIARLRVNVRGQLSTTTRTSQSGSGGTSLSGYGERVTRDDVRVGTQAEDLPGLAVARTYLAVLDLEQASQSLHERLSTLKASRLALEKERNRRARWRLRRLQGDFARLNELATLLAPVAPLESFRAQAQAEGEAVNRRLALLEAADLPPLELQKCAMALRPNMALPTGLEDFLVSQITTTGLKCREAGPDFRLELTFSGGSKGPDFIFAEPQFGGAILYRIEAAVQITDAGGVVLAKAPPIALCQQDTPEGLTAQFRRQFERRWGMLVDQLLAELQ